MKKDRTSIISIIIIVLLFILLLLKQIVFDAEINYFDYGLSLLVTLVFIVLMTIILFAGNYLEIWNRCFLAKSKSKLVRVIGIVVTATAWIFLEAFIVGSINSI